VGATALSSWTKWLFDEFAPRSVRFALLAIYWNSDSTAMKARLVSADTGPTNVTEIVQMVSNGASGSGTIAADNLDVTKAINDLIAGQSSGKCVGLQFAGDGHTINIYGASLELLYGP
jgi:hypothetical protein